MAWRVLVVSLIAIMGCGGSVATGPASPLPLDLDSDSRQLWEGWATQAGRLANATAQMYTSGAMLPDRVADQQRQAQVLAEEIRSAEPSSEPVLTLASDLDDLVGRLEFALEYASNANLVVIRIEIPGLVDAINQLVRDSTALGEMLDQP